MLEFHALDFTILVVNFIVLFFILRKILFLPLARIFREREAATTGALEEARSITSQKDNAIAAMNAELAGAREKAKAARNTLREEGVARQSELMAKAEAEAIAMIEKSRTELQVETEKIRVAMKSDIDQFAEEIIRKMVKV
jgi:F-type H+-transporting ATPase subunit b